MSPVTNKKPRILMVDDEPNVLAGYRRSLASRYEIVTAEGGKAGLEAITTKGPFPVVVTDMRMPEMDGIQFLQAARPLDPDAVFLMLTGNADQDTAVRAVNDGAIFRFLNKPSTPEQLEAAFVAGLRQHELITSERVLLRETLSGSVRLLVEVLTLSDPRAAQTFKSIRTSVNAITHELRVVDDWRFGLAGTLCLLGRVAMSHDEDVLRMSEDHLRECATKGAKLLKHIPRMEQVAAMIERQREAGALPPMIDWNSSADRVTAGARILRLAVDVERAGREVGHVPTAVVEHLKKSGIGYDSALMRALERAFVSGAIALVGATASERVPMKVPIHALQPGMMSDQDLLSVDGKLLLAKGYDLTEIVIDRLQNLARSGTIGGHVVVLVTSSQASSLKAAA